MFIRKEIVCAGTLGMKFHNTQRYSAESVFRVKIFPASSFTYFLRRLQGLDLQSALRECRCTPIPRATEKSAKLG